MADDAASPAMLLAYAIDEIDECLQLIRFGSSGGEGRRRRWWSRLVRTREEVVADNRLLYLNENVERARDHWRDAVGFIDRLASVAADDVLVVGLVADLHTAGVHDVADRLRRHELPSAIPEVIAHLDAVATQLASYKVMIMKTRNLQSINRMRSSGD